MNKIGSCPVESGAPCAPPPESRRVWQALVGTVLLAVLFFSWLWQAFRLYSYPGTLLYYDEPGTLFNLPLFLALTLLALGVASGRCNGWLTCLDSGNLDSSRSAGVSGRTGVWLVLLWTPVLVMLPPLATVFAQAGTVVGLVVSAFAGVGAGLVLWHIGLGLLCLAPRRLVWCVGLIGALTSLCNTLMLFCPASLRLVPALVFPVLCVLLCRTKRPTPQSVKAGVPVSVVGTRFFWAACLLTSFSEGVYCNLDHALVPIMPQPDFDTFALIALGSLAALLVLSWAHKSSVWYAFLLVIPVLVAGYTAWPLLHRESPGLSLGGLLFGYALLKVYMVAAVLHTVSLRSDALQRRLLGLGSGAIVLLFWIGSHNSPWIAERIAAGSTINPLFAFLAFTIVACSLIFVVHLDSMGFFRTVAGTALPKTTAPGKAPLSLADSSLEELEVHFRERGLTRQQAMIAGMLTLKTPDPSICDTLHISPSTLKTHIRNIHRRLGISSRHELAWLVTAPPAQPGNEGQEDGSK